MITNMFLIIKKTLVLCRLLIYELDEEKDGDLNLNLPSKWN